MNIMNVGDGKVVLIAGGDKVYTDIASRFVGSERGLDDILASPYDKRIVENILSSGHLAATEFDYFLFGIEGYSRVTEVQLVRKRLASYLIKSGRPDKGGKRSFDVVLPYSTRNVETFVPLHEGDIYIKKEGEHFPIELFNSDAYNHLYMKVDCFSLLEWTEQWYDAGVKAGFKEEELRYLKPQATEFKAILGLNCHALIDWFKIRCCKNAQTEIRDLANKMLRLCKQASPDLFREAGASCVALGYCPENKRQHKDCKGNRLTHNEVKELINNARN